MSRTISELLRDDKDDEDSIDQWIIEFFDALKRADSKPGASGEGGRMMGIEGSGYAVRKIESVVQAPLAIFAFRSDAEDWASKRFQGHTQYEIFAIGWVGKSVVTIMTN